jgi:ABC-type uncharacterized transport system involved in gliding motility auxiliary subunit
MGEKNKFERYIRLLIYLAVIILINVVGMTLFFRIDLTGNKIYSLSDVSKDVVSTLSEPLTVNVFFTRNLPAPHNNTERYLRDLLEEYRIHANQHFNYRFIDVSPKAETGAIEASGNQKLADNYGIHPVQIQVIEQDEVKFKKAYMGLVLLHGDMIERIPTILSTEGLEYQITTSIQKLNHKISAMLNLEDSIDVKLYLSSSMKAVAPYMGLEQLKDYPDELKEIMDQLNDKNYGRLAYAHVDPSIEKIPQDVRNEDDIMHLEWPDLPQAGIKAGSGMIGLVMTYGGKTISMPLLSAYEIPIIGTRYELAAIEEIKEAVNQNIEALIDINENLGYLADHGTLPTFSHPSMGMNNSEAVTIFSRLVSRNYSLKPIHLKTDSIPEGLGCLVIARPTEKFSDYELYQIDQALMRGTRLAVFMDAFKEEQPQSRQMMGYRPGPTYTPIDTGLQKLLEHYGVRIEPSFVLDENCFKQRVGQQFGGGERPIYFAPLISNAQISHEPEFMNNIKQLVGLKMSPLTLDEKRIADNGLEAHELFTSSEKSWEMKDRIDLNPMSITPPEADDQQAPRTLACLLEGRFPSYFKDREIPVKTVEESGDDQEQSDAVSMEPGENPEESESSTEKSSEIDLSRIKGRARFIPEGRRPSRVFVTGSSELLKNVILDEEGKSSNAVFVMNMIDALNGREDIAAMRSKEQRLNPLHETTALTKMLVKTVNIAGLPIVVIVFGLLMWLKRNARKKQIQKMFQQ